jgi:hypothetical protein
MKVAKWFTVGATLSLLAVAPVLASDASADRAAAAKQAQETRAAPAAPREAARCACGMAHEAQPTDRG